MFCKKKIVADKCFHFAKHKPLTQHLKLFTIIKYIKQQKNEHKFCKKTNK